MPRHTQEIRGGNWKQRTVVPGVKVFDNDYISDWLDGQGTTSDINLSLLRDKHPKWLKTANQNGKLIAIELEGKLKEINTNKDKRFDYKREHLQDIIELSKNKLSDYDQLKNRHFFYDTLKECVTLTTNTRLLVGLSGGSVFENSLSLHRLYSFPIIPGSALKGIANHFCDEYLDPTRISEDEKKAIFGAKAGSNNEGGSEGGVVFMDAWPDAWPDVWPDEGFFDLDILNPHYPDYYKENSFPQDNQSPIPNIFLAVRKGVRFKFCVMPSSNCKDYNLIRKAKDVLEEALKTFGVGAKTGSSYGYFI